MKQIKNAIFAIAGGLLMVTVASVSCKKTETTTPPAGNKPVISSAATANGTVGVAFSYTITASNTPTSYSATGLPAGLSVNTSTGVIGGTPTTAGASTVTISATNASGTGTKALAITITAAAVGATSDSVAKAFLIAHWPFDADNKEKGTGVGASQTVGTVNYSNAGRIGNAATFTNGALVYPNIASFHDSAMQSYTISMWIKLPPHDGSHWRSLWQLNSNAYTDIFGIVGIQALNAQPSSDTLALQVDQVQIDGTGPHLGGFGLGANFPGLTTPLFHKFVETKWSLLTVTYNGQDANQKLKVYADGVVLDSLDLTTVTKPETFRIDPDGGPTAPIPPVWENYVTIGTFNWKDFPAFAQTNGYGGVAPLAADRSGYMSNGINGMIDDIRVWKTAISPAEVTELYNLGLLGK